MPIVDLTWDFIGERFAPEIIRDEIPLKSDKTAYTGIVYKITHDGMSGTYIDFPGHIAETDNGLYADNCPIESVYRIPASVIHLQKGNASGAVGAEELQSAFNGDVPNTPGLIINALGNKFIRDIENRSVYLDNSAVEWIIGTGCRFLVSDIYESPELEGVFLKLFQAGITTVCMPVNLHLLTEKEVKLSMIFPKIPKVTQLPCRLVAEF